MQSFDLLGDEILDGLRLPGSVVKPEKRPQVTLPAIAHMVGDHYATVYEVLPTRLLVGDPAGVIALSELEFRSSWTDYLLLLVNSGGESGLSPHRRH